MANGGRPTQNRRKRRVLWGLIAVGLALWIFSPEPSIERVGPHVDPVTRTFDVDAETARRRLRSGLDSALKESLFSTARVVAFSEPRLPGQWQIKPGELAVSYNKKNNPGLT